MVVVVIAISALGVGGYYAFEHQAAERHEADREERKHASDVTAERLVKDYDANEVNADNLYRGTWLRVSGTAGHVTKDLLDNVHLTLDVRGTLLGVSCGVNDASEVANVRPGDQVVLLCRGAGRTLGVPDLKDCTVDSVGSK